MKGRRALAPRRRFDLHRALVGERMALSGPLTGSTGIVYDGAKRDRLTSDWRGSSGSGDTDLLPALQILRERSRELVRNNPIAAAIVRVIVDNVVGTGIRVQARVDAEALGFSPEQAAAWNSRAEALFREWCRHADLRDLTDFYGLQAMQCERWIVDGEVLGMPVQLERVGRNWLTALQVLECDRLMDPLDGSVPLERLRSGVELDAFGAPLAYWIARQHPGDRFVRQELVLDRVPAWTADGLRRVQHLLLVTRDGQSRGQPMLAPIMDDLRHLGQYDEAELIAARIAACHTVWRKQEIPEYTLEQPATTASGGEPVTEIEPGLVVDLLPGEDVTFGNPSRPSSNYEPYVRAKLRQAGAPYGLPLELVLADWSEVTWTSGRMALIEAKRAFRRMQAHLIDRSCVSVYELVIEEAIRTGRLEAPTFEQQRSAWLRHAWIPPGWTWVDPVKEAQASQMAISAGLSTLAEECAGQGRDWQETAEQRAREIAYYRRLGLPLGSVETVKASGPASASEAPAAGQDEEQERTPQQGGAGRR